jgi:hypothetical protein
VTGASGGETPVEVCVCECRRVLLQGPPVVPTLTGPACRESFLVVVIRKRLPIEESRGVIEWAAAWGGQKGGMRCAAHRSWTRPPFCVAPMIGRAGCAIRLSGLWRHTPDGAAFCSLCRQFNEAVSASARAAGRVRRRGTGEPI